MSLRSKKMLKCIGDYLTAMIFGGFDISNENDSDAISNRIYEEFQRPSRLTLKHHLLILHMPKKLFISMRETPLNDKQDWFTRERLFQRVA